ncbi:MAG: DUF4270 domain-containing protein [Tannerella sp.]|jgi:hypothetical protein|nr:DUF4270 domain-containing protein [Tannerella sp.]
MMKGIKKHIALCCLLTALISGACDDNLTKVGTTVLPPDDLITVYTDTFRIKASTVKLDSVFAKTTTCMLGEMYDPDYGTLKADFLCQFYCKEGFRFAETPYNGKIDSIDLYIFYMYNTYGGLMAYGDTIAPMQVTVFPVNRPLTRNFYTNDDPEKYCTMNNPLGSCTYTAYDMAIPDSVRNSDYYIPNIRVKLPLELGQRFYDETVNNPSTFDSQSSFNGFFPGVYITNTFGSGNLILTSGENIAIRISYSYTGKGSEGQDSLFYGAQWFYSAKDVYQITRFKNSQIDRLLEENPTHTYIKSPAGVCTKLVIPTTEISNKLDVQDRFINSLALNLKYLPVDERDFAYMPPSHLLLLPEDSVRVFFENASIEDNATSYVSFLNMGVNAYGTTYQCTSSYETPDGYSSYTRTYAFGNISRLLETHVKNSPDKDLSLLVIPIVREATSSNSYYYTTGITHTLTPSGLKIRTDEELMKIVVLSSKFEGKK